MTTIRTKSNTFVVVFFIPVWGSTCWTVDCLLLRLYVGLSIVRYITNIFCIGINECHNVMFYIICVTLKKSNLYKNKHFQLSGKLECVHITPVSGWSFGLFYMMPHPIQL